MTSTPVSNLSQAGEDTPLISKTGKLWVGVLGVLMIALHWHFLYRMAKIGMSDSDWSHVLIIPAISIYYIYLHRAELLATPRRVCRWGLPFIVAGIAGYILGIYPIRNDMAMGYSMIMTLFGVVLLLLGPAMMRVLWFPIAFLVFAIKVSDAIWSVIASKMQGLAAYGAVVLLDLTSGLTDMHASLKGSTIHLDYMLNGVPTQTPMNVAEACAGMRMLMAFLALGVALAFLFPRRWWQRAVMIALAAPIAIFVNVLRVAVLGWLHLIDPELAHGDFHLFIGMLMLIPAAGLLMLVGWCLDKVLIVEGTRETEPAPLPPETDPNQLNLDPPVLMRSVGLGALLVLLLGGCYMLLLNELSQGKLLSWLSGSMNTVGLVVGVLLLIGVGVLVWRAFPKADRFGRLFVAQGLTAGVLLTAAVGHFSALQAMGVAMHKKPLELRHGLRQEFPEAAGNWEQLFLEPSLLADVEAELGTKQYFTRWYLDTSTGKRPEDVYTPPDPENPDAPHGFKPYEPGEVAQIHVTYYTGMLDTVPHVPDKCWIVAGKTLAFRETVTLNLDRDDYRPDPEHEGMWLVPTTFGTESRLPKKSFKAIAFGAQDEEGRGLTALYFFMANGKPVASNHEVRFSFNMRDRYSYFAKVELLFPGLVDAESVTKRAEALLSDLYPEIMACLPDWTEVQAGTYPAPVGAASKPIAPAQPADR